MGVSEVQEFQIGSGYITWAQKCSFLDGLGSEYIDTWTHREKHFGPRSAPFQMVWGLSSTYGMM